MPTADATHRNIFSGLPKDLGEALFAGARPVRIAADQVLFVAGEAGTGCYRIDRGLLKVSAISASGGERILAILGAGTVVGELSVLDEEPRSATVTAIKDSELSFLSRSDFLAFADARSEVYKRLVVLLARRLRTTNAAIAAASFLPLQGRVARALLDLSEAFGDDVGGGRVVVRQKITQSDLAAMAGIARENVSRILNDWKRQSVVSQIAGYYCLENRALLEGQANL